MTETRAPSDRVMEKAMTHIGPALVDPDLSCIKLDFGDEFSCGWWVRGDSQPQPYYVTGTTKVLDHGEVVAEWSCPCLARTLCWHIVVVRPFWSPPAGNVVPIRRES